MPLRVRCSEAKRKSGHEVRSVEHGQREQHAYLVDQEQRKDQDEGWSADFWGWLAARARGLLPVRFGGAPAGAGAAPGLSADLRGTVPRPARTAARVTPGDSAGGLTTAVTSRRGSRYLRAARATSATVTFMMLSPYCR